MADAPTIAPTSPASSRPRRRFAGRPRLAVVPAAFAAVALLTSTGCLPPPPPTVHPVVHPVAGRFSLVDTFGAPRSGGRTHEGQDLMAAKLTPVVAVADGVVTSLSHSNSGLSGNYLVVTADDGWRYTYIHLNNDTPGTDDGVNPYEWAFADGIIKGQRVKAGEVVGFVGDSGNAESTGSHLHFEARDAAGTLVNPYASLVYATRYVRTTADRLADAPRGSFDGAGRAPNGTVEVWGWAIDHHHAAPVKVSVYVNGTPVTTVTATVNRPDVAAAFPPWGPAHGYGITGISAPPASRVCMIAHSLGGGGGTRLACTVV